MKTNLPNLSEKLSQVYGFTVYLKGPYLCQDGRKRVDVRSETKGHPLCKTIQLARVRLEIKLGRPLRKGETVDHKNNDPSDDRYENVQLLTLAKNSAKQTEEAKEKARQACREPAERLRRSFSVRGDRNPLSRLSNEEAKTYRLKYKQGSTISELACRAGVSKASIKSLLRGSTYVEAGGPIFKLPKGKVGRPPRS
jgi:hypothetical protein